MLELVYDNDLTYGGSSHTLEIYVNEGGTEAVAVLLPPPRTLLDACHEVWELAQSTLRRVAPKASARVLLCELPARRYSWLDADPPPPRWREVGADEVRGSGLSWA